MNKSRGVKRSSSKFETSADDETSSSDSDSSTSASASESGSETTIVSETYARSDSSGSGHENTSGSDSEMEVESEPEPEPERKPVPKIEALHSQKKRSKSEAHAPPKKETKGSGPQDQKPKWKTLEHNGPAFPPAYQRLPPNINLRYDRKIVKNLSAEAEEAACFYARVIDQDIAKNEAFNRNFFQDWKELLSIKSPIRELAHCDFREIANYLAEKQAEKKAMSKEAKLQDKNAKEEVQKKFGFCTIDKKVEKIGNFYVEPPGLFRGRGAHPAMGKIKSRIQPEDVVINCSEGDAPVAPKGHNWKEVRHDQNVCWLACWKDPIQGNPKYIMLNQTSMLKGNKDRQKYQKARQLSKEIAQIRKNYSKDLVSGNSLAKQTAVAVYFIDKLALRAGNEKSAEKTADTVGCCSLRVEHVKALDRSRNIVAFDFLGKDSIPYKNEVEVERVVFENVQQLMRNKKNNQKLFDKLTTSTLNEHLSKQMPGLTAKVFRTYNASHTLQKELDKSDLKASDDLTAKLFAYNSGNRKVAKLCNHQRAVPKTFDKQMENLDKKIEDKRDDIRRVKKEVKGLGKESKSYEKKREALKKLRSGLAKLETTKVDKEAGKSIALGTSKLNYLDPRISVAWCKKWNVPIEKIFNKTQRAKFQWAIDEVDEEFKFD